jgi:hypothetical protein
MIKQGLYEVRCAFGSTITIAGELGLKSQSTTLCVLVKDFEEVSSLICSGWP